MRLLLKTWSTNEHFNADCDYAYLDLSPEVAQLLLKRIETFKALKAADSLVDSLVYWDNIADFIAIPDFVMNCDLESGLDSAEVFDAPQDFALGPDSVQRTECNRMEVTDSGVRFRAYPKYCEFLVESAELDVKTLEEALCLTTT